eukprot:TRINITY_DN22477_c0_g1_i1.p1 TRINITY_DN22477_c0_g1~~TRINITY_DN22477_c0_g1_i1.p1  ORF type:complete len:289 (-),score=91.75 TRINITY_DN22477_c0_g1_i1:100-966(-)
MAPVVEMLAARAKVALRIDAYTRSISVLWPKRRSKKEASEIVRLNRLRRNLQAAHDNVMQILTKIDESSQNQEIVGAIAAGTAALQSLLKGLDVASVDEVWVDAKMAVEDVDRAQAVLNEPLLAEDQASLEAEFAQLERDVAADTTTPITTAAPSTTAAATAVTTHKASTKPATIAPPTTTPTKQASTTTTATTTATTVAATTPPSTAMVATVVADSDTKALTASGQAAIETQFAQLEREINAGDTPPPATAATAPKKTPTVTHTRDAAADDVETQLVAKTRKLAIAE